MIKILKNIFAILSLYAVVACSEDIHIPKNSDILDLGDKISVDISLNVADLTEVSTRAFSEDPDYEDLKLYAIEFKYDEAGGPLSDGSAITKIYTDSIANETLNADDGDIHFNITLDKIDEPRVLHLIAVPKSVDLNIPYELSLEGSVISTIRVENSTPAYWQRIVFPKGYGSFSGSENKWTTNETEMEKLQHVPMLRNFAKISLEVSASNFELEGFAVLNQPRAGYVAPWDAKTDTFANFLNADNSMRSYDEIDEEYKGNTPGNLVANIDANIATTADDKPKYLYERPNSSINFPLIILRGHRADGVTMYYKLDLGRSVNNDPFKFYDILRNFEFAIDVTKIEANGYETAQEAYEGVVFNNFSFDVNTNKMLNVSNGEDMLWVNQTTFVVTNPDQTEITFLYRYRTGITSEGGGVNANGSVQLLGLETGEAIDSIIYGGDNSSGWRQVTIITPEPTTARRVQEFVVYNPTSGLGRTIRIVVRSPWFYTNAGVWGGNYNFYQQFIDNEEAREEWNGYVSSDTGNQPLTVRFHIDDNIPEALFPLKFTFESDRQNIQNNYVGNLLVEYGSSYFDDTKTALKYVKTVTWADYNSELTQDNETGTIVDDDSDGITSHVVRARFLTMLPIVAGETTKIRIYNEYNRVQGDPEPYLEVSFVGKEGQAPNYDPDWNPGNGE